VARWQEGLISGALALLLQSPADALEVERLDVSFQNDRYVVIFKAQLRAQAEAVGTVLKDYEHYPALDPRITESRVLPSDHDGRVRLFTRMWGCVGGLFCRTMQRVEVVEERPGELIATAVLSESDVHIGVTRSEWSPHDGGTALGYRLEIMPKFWIPPLFGRRLMITTLREGTLSLFTNVESAAQRVGSGE
jgi:hypothetical protein